MRAFVRFMQGAGIACAALCAVVLWMAAPLALLAVSPALPAWLWFTRPGRQALAVAASGLSTIPRRLGGTSVVVVGIGGVVAVLVALLSMAAGFEATLKESGGDDTAIVLRGGSEAEVSSGLERADVTLIAQAPGVARDAREAPLASPEIVVIANIPLRSSGTDANVVVRGVGPGVWDVRPEVKLISGRRFRPGLRELVVGQGALRQFDGIGPGAEIRLNNQGWRIVGVFASGDAHDSELWGDAETVATAYRRNGFQSVTLRLEGAQGLARLRTALDGDPRLKVDVQTTREYYNKQSEQLTRMIRVLGTGVAIIRAIGAVLGAINTMSAAIAARAREIATLRALGFTGGPVVVAVLLEAMLLALAGGVFGAAVAYVLFNGYTVSTLGGNFSQVVFQFRVTPALLLQGLQWALGIGFLGGLLPALRAARIPITVALRES
ncbi:MAG: FtsX-like permease family protein [Gammaproteobacteria bacterium]|nr:FtsX-like permease family protein [Gammaproteobacteria bacterium]